MFLPVDAPAAFEAFLTPPKVPPLSSEARLLAGAATHRLRLGPNGYARGGDAEVQVYAWGGEGPPVLFVHGWGGNAGNHAAGIRAVVEAGGRALAFDAPGHGRSEGTLSSAPAFAWALEAVAREAGPLHGIVAHSLGGGAACIALGRGVRAARAVLLASSCWVEPVLADFAARQGFSPELTAAVQRVASAEFAPDEASALPALARLHGTSALLMHDPEDREMPHRHSAAIAAAWPGAVLVDTPKVGHRRILRAQAVVDRACRYVLTGELTAEDQRAA